MRIHLAVHSRDSQPDSHGSARRAVRRCSPAADRGVSWLRQEAARRGGSVARTINTPINTSYTHMRINSAVSRGCGRRGQHASTAGDIEEAYLCAYLPHNGPRGSRVTQAMHLRDVRWLNGCDQCGGPLYHAQTCAGNGHAHGEREHIWRHVLSSCTRYISHDGATEQTWLTGAPYV